MKLLLADEYLMDSSVNFIYDKTLSFASKQFSLILPLIGIKGLVERKMKQGKFSQEDAAIPLSLVKKYQIDVMEIDERRVWTLKPRKNISDKVILYLHGGSYIFNITKYHWQLIDKLLEQTQATFIVPDYPLAPKATYEDTYSLVDKLYSIILTHSSSENIIFLGDSAGGGLALGFAQEQRNLSRPQPSQIILLSPWLDITMSNPEIITIDKQDKVLGIKGLQLAGEAYRGGLDAKHYKVSPVYGTFSGLGKISLFIGTNDILLPDAVKLKQLVNNEGLAMNYFQYNNMFHDWIIFTKLPESCMAIKQIASIINEEN